MMILIKIFTRAYITFISFITIIFSITTALGQDSKQFQETMFDQVFTLVIVKGLAPPHYFEFKIFS